MKINRFHLQHNSLESARTQRNTPPESSETEATAGNAARRSQLGGIGMIREYLDRLLEVPEVRTDLVETARARYAAGEYGTRQSAVETAAAILNRP